MYYPETNSTYEGTFNNGMRHGIGKYETPTYIYHGYFRNDKKWGIGIQIKKGTEYNIESNEEIYEG